MNVISDTENISSHGPSVFDGQPAVGALKQAWYKEDVESIDDDERQLLEEYSRLKTGEMMPHVLALRDKAFRIWSYACIGQMRFLANNLSRLPFHQKVLARLRSGATFCDAGCCFGQELRFLVHQGIPSTQPYGFDLESDFIEFGYQLIRDRDRFRATFVSADVLASPTSFEGVGLTELEGKMDVVFASSFLHVFDWDRMIVAVKRLVSLTRPQAGSMVLGKQMGSVVAGQYRMPTALGFNYRHNAESMQRFWQQIGKETDSTWKVEAELYEGLFELAENKHHAWADSDTRMLWFCAPRE